ncbi:MAG: hypothetical protein AABX38_01860 [Candidatus Micrarchaeota archaeon]
MFELLGIVGLSLILIGWIYETYNLVKTRKSNLPLSFSILYSLGSLCLAVYSYLLGDLIFLALNVVATLIAMLNVLIGLNTKGKKKSLN